MKIRIKNSGNKITEALDNPAKQAPQQTPFNYYNANIKEYAHTRYWMGKDNIKHYINTLK